MARVSRPERAFRLSIIVMRSTPRASGLAKNRSVRARHRRDPPADDALGVGAAFLPHAVDHPCRPLHDHSRVVGRRRQAARALCRRRVRLAAVALGEADHPAGHRSLLTGLLGRARRAPCHRLAEIHDVRDWLAEYARHGRRLPLFRLDREFVIADAVQFAHEVLQNNGADIVRLVRVRRDEIGRGADAERDEALGPHSPDAPDFGYRPVLEQVSAQIGVVETGSGISLFQLRRLRCSEGWMPSLCKRA